MRDALLNSGRDIVFSICAWGYQDWMPKTGNLWRTTGDIANAWKASATDWFRGVADIIEENEKHYANAGPGHWNDPDMLQVGNGKLTDNEARSQMTMWAIMAAPLLTGNDIRKMSASTKEIYMNADMIAVDQDSAGVPGHRIKNDNGKQVWIRPLGGEGSGKMAVALYNSSESEQTIDLNFEDIGYTGEVMVRDVWQKKDLGMVKDGLSSNVAPHHVTFLIVTAKLDPPEPFSGKAVDLPGTIQAENFDKGSSGLAYSDKDSENQGKVYRTDVGVDIVQVDSVDASKGYAVGYTNAEEWMKYSVNVKKAGKYYVFASVASGLEKSGFRLFIDDKAVTDTILIPQGPDWNTYSEISTETASIDAGSHMLKLQITGSYANIDWIKFCTNEKCEEENEEKPVTDTPKDKTPAADKSLGLATSLRYGVQPMQAFRVHSMNGAFVGTVYASSIQEVQMKIRTLVPERGVYLVRSKNGMTFQVRR